MEKISSKMSHQLQKLKNPKIQMKNKRKKEIKKRRTKKRKKTKKKRKIKRKRKKKIAMKVIEFEIKLYLKYHKNKYGYKSINMI